MAENVKVIVRCRPMNQKEISMKCQDILKIDDCTVNLENPTDRTAPDKSFTFDSVYGANAPTEAIYNEICYTLVESVLEGYNSTIFAYGQTGCGKSHTMQGPTDYHTNPKLLAQRGIISRSFEHIFEAISLATEVRYLALVSFLEIYNESIRDLLAYNHNATNNLNLKEMPGEGVTVQNLSVHEVHNVQECEQLLINGSKNRMVAGTLMNAGSSRSHSIFTISLEQIQTSENLSDPTAKPAIKKGKLNLVDLAGSERQTKTGATGDRLKEATKINLSLSALGNVISALVDGKTKHIPYRDSKLTRLLQDSLGGNTKTLMVACASPADYNFDETLSTLRYANRAKNISNKPKINEDPKEAKLREYQQEITELRKLLESSGGLKQTENFAPSIDSKWLEIEKEKLKAEYRAETLRLKMDQEAQQREKQELVRDMENLKQHYEKQLKSLIHQSRPNSDCKDQNSENFVENSGVIILRNGESQLNGMEKRDISNRIKEIKNALIGGERANDLNLKEKRNKKKAVAERKFSALARALNNVEDNSERELLQCHYTDIQQELNIKADNLKAQKQKIRGLEREITDIQAEFQLDREDYLETIRKLEKSNKFYEQLVEKAMAHLRRDGRMWDIDVIKSESVWNDDFKKWKLPENLNSRLKLPQAQRNIQKSGRESTSLTAPGRLERSSSDLVLADHNDNEQECVSCDDEHHSDDPDECEFLMKKLQNSNANDMIQSYFRPRRAETLIHQNRAYSPWSDNRNRSFLNSGNNLMNATWTPTGSLHSGANMFNKTWDGSPFKRPNAALTRIYPININ